MSLSRLPPDAPSYAYLLMLATDSQILAGSSSMIAESVGTERGGSEVGNTSPLFGVRG